MKAVAFHGKRDIRVDTVPDPTIEQPTDAVVRITSTGICGSDLHLYEVMGAFMDEGDILGHEPMGIVEEVGSEVSHIKPGDRVVIPFNISCGNCYMCDQKLYSQCETTQVREQDKGAALLGYTKLYGQVRAVRPSCCAFPRRTSARSRCPEARLTIASSTSPTSCPRRGRRWSTRPSRTAARWPCSDWGRSARCAAGSLCIRARLRCSASIWLTSASRSLAATASRRSTRASTTDVTEPLREQTDGRGPDSVIDAVGMEAHGSPMGKLAHQLAGMLPDAVTQAIFEKGGIDRLSVLHTAIDSVRRGGTISLSGVYGGTADPMPMMDLFDKQIQLRMGQANVKRWIDDIMPLLNGDGDPLGVEDLATHKLPLDQAPHAYEIFQKKEDGAIKILLQP